LRAIARIAKQAERKKPWHIRAIYVQTLISNSQQLSEPWYDCSELSNFDAAKPSHILLR
jgi:hypothetical protein